MRVVNNVLHNTLAQVSARARFTSSTWSSMSCAWVSVLWLSVPHLVPFRVFLLSILLLPEPWAEPLPPCGRHRAICHWHSRQLRSLAPWPKTPLSHNWEHQLYHRIWPEILKQRIEGQKCEIQNSSKRSTDNTRVIEQLGWSQPHFDSRCLCWWKSCYIDIICQPNYGTSNQSSTTTGKSPRAVLTEGALNAKSSINIDCRSDYATIEHLENSSDNSSIPTTFYQ